MRATFHHFPTRAAAQAHAPRDQVFTVVDRTRKARPRPSVDDVIKAGRGVLDIPYPHTSKASWSGT